MYLGPNSNQAKRQVKKTVAPREIKPTIQIYFVCWTIMGLLYEKNTKGITSSRNLNYVSLPKGSLC